jgi:hypothetical protein
MLNIINKLAIITLTKSFSRNNYIFIQQQQQRRWRRRRPRGYTIKLMKRSRKGHLGATCISTRILLPNQPLWKSTLGRNVAWKHSRNIPTLHLLKSFSRRWRVVFLVVGFYLSLSSSTIQELSNRLRTN